MASLRRLRDCAWCATTSRSASRRCVPTLWAGSFSLSIILTNPDHGWARDAEYGGGLLGGEIAGRMQNKGLIAIGEDLENLRERLDDRVGQFDRPPILSDHSRTAADLAKNLPDPIPFLGRQRHHAIDPIHNRNKRTRRCFASLIWARGFPGRLM